jgi:predicted DNA-binding protein YlxM (UPF0122 family)
MEKNMQVSLLFDFYGSLLKDQQQDAVSLYYNDDPSLAEVSERLGITRQGVRDCIKRAEARLFMYEEKLGLLERFRTTESGLLEIESLARSLEAEYDREKVSRIESIAKSLHE